MRKLQFTSEGLIVLQAIVLEAGDNRARVNRARGLKNLLNHKS